MRNKSYTSQLTSKEKSFCEYSGLFGILLTLTCLIQHFVVAIPGRITNPMIPAYFLAIASFLLLALLKSTSQVFLIISAVLSIVIEWRWMTSYSFSMVVLLLVIYHIVIIVILFSEEIPRKLKAIEQAKKDEESLWRDKI